MPTTTPAAPNPEPGFAAAGVFLERLASFDFSQLAAALEEDAVLDATVGLIRNSPATENTHPARSFVS